MLSVVLFISGGEIFLILLAILIFFGADKIPEFARIMGKGVREFKKATDDIKREFSENTSGVMDDIKSIRDDMSDTFTKEISQPVQETVDETSKTFEEYKDQYNVDYYYNNPDYTGSRGNEYQTETTATALISASDNIDSADSTDSTPDDSSTDVHLDTDDSSKPADDNTKQTNV